MSSPAPRTIAFVDRRSGIAFDLQVPPSSPWYDLLPEHQDVEILPANNNEARPSAPAHVGHDADR